MTSFLISPENRSPLCPRQSGDDNRTGSANGGHFTTTDWLIDWLSGCDEASGTKEKRALFTKQNGWRLMKVSVNCRRVTDVCHITFWAPSSLRMIHSSGLPNGQEDRNMPSPWISTRTIQFGTLAHSIDNYFCVIRASTSLLSCKHAQKKKTTKKLTASETNLWLKGNTARAVLLPTKIASRSSSHPLRSIKVCFFFFPQPQQHSVRIWCTDATALHGHYITTSVFDSSVLGARNAASEPFSMQNANAGCRWEGILNIPPRAQMDTRGKKKMGVKHLNTLLSSSIRRIR